MGTQCILVRFVGFAGCFVKTFEKMKFVFRSFLMFSTRNVYRWDAWEPIHCIFFLWTYAPLTLSHHVWPWRKKIDFFLIILCRFWLLNAKKCAQRLSENFEEQWRWQWIPFCSVAFLAHANDENFSHMRPDCTSHCSSHRILKCIHFVHNIFSICTEKNNKKKHIVGFFLL